MPYHLVECRRGAHLPSFVMSPSSDMASATTDLRLPSEQGNITTLDWFTTYCLVTTEHVRELELSSYIVT